MDARNLARWMVFGMVVVGLALPVLRTDAAVTGPFDYDSREQFEGECHDIGGTFTDMGDGNLWCQGPDGSQTVCDANGHDCYHIPVLRGSTGGVEQLPGNGGLATTNGGGATPTAPITHLP